MKKFFWSIVFLLFFALFYVGVSGTVHNESENPIDLLMLVNRDNPIDTQFRVELKEYEGKKVHRVVIPDLKKLYHAASLDGIRLNINTSYRTYQSQENIWNTEFVKWLSKGYSRVAAQNEVMKTVMPPGYSEHETGLAIDFSIPGQVIENEKMWDWLGENAHLYGFILRYPEDKVDITKISYEPWHYRYVGVMHSKEIFEKGLCLEEYLERDV